MRSWPVGGDDVDERHPAAGDGPRLVEHDRVDAARGLEHLGALDEQSELGAAAGAHEQCGGGGQAERARAGDDEDGDGGGERERGVLAGAEPEPQRGDRQPDHDGHEDGGDTVGEPLHGGLAALGVAHQPRDLRERGVGADPRGPDHEPPAGVDRGAGDVVAGLLLDRHGLAGQQRLVDRASTLLDDPVGRDLLAGAHDEAVAGLELLDRDAALGAGGIEPGDVLGAQLEQPGQRGAGAPLGARLEVPAGEDEHRHRARHLEVDLVGATAALGDEVEAHRHPRHAGVAEEQGVQRPAERGQHADRDERVHRRRRVLEVGPGGTMERPCAPEHDGCGAGQAQPLPVVELQRRDHGEDEHRCGERERDQQPPAQRRSVVALGLGLAGGGQDGVVAGGLDGGDELLGPHAPGVEGDRGLLRGVVHAGADAIERVQRALDAVGARGAGHAVDRQLEACRLRGHG